MTIVKRLSITLLLALGLGGVVHAQQAPSQADRVDQLDQIVGLSDDQKSEMREFMQESEGKINRKLDLDTIYEQVRDFRGKWPDHKFGYYTIHWWVPEDGRLIREYPNSVIIGKDGQPVPAGSPEKPLRSSWGNGMICYWRELGHPPTYDFMVGMMRDWVKNFEMDFLYFDGWPAGNYMWNWRLNHVTQPYTWVDYYFDIRRAIQAVSPECAIFLNADTRPMMDINFWERGSWHGGRDSKEWRIIKVALKLLGIKSSRHDNNL